MWPIEQVEFVWCTAMGDRTPPSIQAHYSDSWSGKVSNILHTIPPCIKWLSLDARWNFKKRWTGQSLRSDQKKNTLCRSAGDIIRRRKANAGCTVRQCLDWHGYYVQKLYNVDINVLWWRNLKKKCLNAFTSNRLLFSGGAMYIKITGKVI
jgi:hypothetical protein